jgi:hypothetical protein
VLRGRPPGTRSGRLVVHAPVPLLAQRRDLQVMRRQQVGVPDSERAGQLRLLGEQAGDGQHLRDGTRTMAWGRPDVFTTARGREVVFWQSPRTVKQSRPGVHRPTARAAGIPELEVLVDIREQYPYASPTSESPSPAAPCQPVTTPFWSTGGWSPPWNANPSPTSSRRSPSAG